MDLATIIGLILAWGAVIVSLMMEGGSLAQLFHPGALILVVGGTLGSTIISFSLKQIMGIPAYMRKAFLGKDENMGEIIKKIVGFARRARKDGILALEEEVKDVDNRFLKMGIQLVVDGTPSEMVREIMETEIVSMQERHKVGEMIFATMGGNAPTLGIIGTVMGLVNMLSRLEDPGAMGPAIAAAFAATLYGVLLANLVCLPIGAKLKARTTDEIIAYDMIVEGVLSIQAGDNPRMVETKMLAFLPPKMRQDASSEGSSRE